MILDLFEPDAWSDLYRHFPYLCKDRLVGVICGRWLQGHEGLDVGRRIPHQNGRNLTAGTP
ncbi:hypothetical protein [Hyphomonas sp.]|uniref:hypothetical protein n=1 Tax=Hyphomonas sp. TaxID=87 RepID=UPI000C975325|nr:hypothetical protein [Hyphomonas sp.]MAL44855.1 hypothetical protein [Hyphomonas sp.]